MQNIKTPATVLQEFTVAYGFAPPQYVLVTSQLVNHENEFHYKVDVASLCETGCGYSKKLAKQNAASKVLKLLADQGLHEPSSTESEESSSFLKPLENYIGTLNTLCKKLKLCQPLYKEIFNVGSLSVQQFTYECIVGSISTQATAYTKKEAKQTAAKNMLSAPTLKEQCVVKPNSTDDDAKISKIYEKLSKGVDVNHNKKAVNVDDFPKLLKMIMQKKNIRFEDFKEQFQSRNRESLDYIFNILNVQYTIIILQKSPHIATALFRFAEGLTTSFTVMALGSSEESAIINLICDIFSILDVYIGVPEISHN